jgi:hypothetical protein
MYVHRNAEDFWGDFLPKLRLFVSVYNNTISKRAGSPRMKKSQAILTIGLLIALAVAGWAGAWGYRERQTNAELQEMLWVRAAEATRFEQRIQTLEKQISSDKDAAKVRSEQHENELATLKKRNAELQSLNEKANHRLEFSEQLSRLPRYETAEQLLGLPASVLKEAHNDTCVENFKDSSGNQFSIGGPGASSEVANFIQSLEDGKTYSLPAAFIEYQKKQKQP